MSIGQHQLVLNAELLASQLAHAMYCREVLNRRYRHSVERMLPSPRVDVGRVEEWGFDPLFVFDRAHGSGLYEWRDCVVLFSVGSGLVQVYAAGHPEQLDELLALIKENLPPLGPPTSVRVKFHFMDSRHGVGDSRTRSIRVPAWEEIHSNYAPDVRSAIDELVKLERPEDGGQLILWHGAPGTGKTFAIRALARAWREWCDVEFVTDPEAFFRQASYLLSIVLSEGVGTGDRWQLLVVEDAGELLRPDAKTQVGQGLSRLLNLVDGMLGQGLRLLVLITTNEPLKKVHPAVARPGRCRSLIEFEPFDQMQAAQWLNDRGHDATPGGLPGHIAGLYALLEGQSHPPDQPALGFATA